MITEIGEPITPDVDRFSVSSRDNCETVFPVRDDGTEMMWSVTPNACRKLLEKGYIKATKYQKDKPQQFAVSYLSSGTINDKEDEIVPLQDRFSKLLGKLLEELK